MRPRPKSVVGIDLGLEQTGLVRLSRGPSATLCQSETLKYTRRKLDDEERAKRLLAFGRGVVEFVGRYPTDAVGILDYPMGLKKNQKGTFSVGELHGAVKHAIMAHDHGLAPVCLTDSVVRKAVLGYAGGGRSGRHKQNAAEITALLLPQAEFGSEDEGDAAVMALYLLHRI